MNTTQILIRFPIFSSFPAELSCKRCSLGLKSVPPTNSFSPQQGRKIGFPLRNRCSIKFSAVSFPLLGVDSQKGGILGRKESLIVVRGFGFNGGDGGGMDKGNNSRILGNFALAIGLTYLTWTGQLGWILDTIVSIWLLAVLLPIVGLGAFFWYARQNIVQSSCPNCGNSFEMLKSSLNDGLQLCPFCTQPFSVQDNKFVRESSKFTNDQSAPSGQVFNGFSPRVEKGKVSSATVVDIEAEVKDID